MDVLYSHCCGLDVHKKNVVACALTPEGKEIRTFSTMTRNLHELRDWILSKGCTHVAMESTGVLWKPVYNVLEPENLEIMVVNAKNIKNVPGRKSDVKDAEWIAGLLRHGLLTGSFIPKREQRENRELGRYRQSLIEERTRAINRVQKVLEGGNIKLSSVASNVLGKSSRAMLEAIIHGENDLDTLTDLAHGNMKASPEELKQALTGVIGSHQLLMLESLLRHIDFLNEEIEKLDKEIGERLRPFELELELLDTIPGVGRRTAELIVIECGTDMGQFPSAAHFVSWAGFAPGQNESAGKKKPAKTRKGNKKLRSGIVQASRAAARQKNTYLSSFYNRLARRVGKKRAAVATGRKILTIAYHVLKDKEPYKELGPNYYDERIKTRVINQAIKRLESLGCKVTIESVA
ncbi:IS110 family RNA-guided transposase [Effusibacillus pohliae]|nr:IS110 family transposase [Effusibacillus pohliae]